jgi:hypothetical protein
MRVPAPEGGVGPRPWGERSGGRLRRGWLLAVTLVTLLAVGLVGGDPSRV